MSRNEEEVAKEKQEDARKNPISGMIRIIPRTQTLTILGCILG